MNRRLSVPGTPVPQGSTKAFAVKGRAFTTSTNAGPLARYRNDIRNVWGESDMTDHPVELFIDFRFKRPQSHYNSKGELKGSKYATPAPTFVTAKPDLDKLCRAVMDALTGYAYRDDSQVVRVNAIKVYADDPVTDISIREVQA